MTGANQANRRMLLGRNDPGRGWQALSAAKLAAIMLAAGIGIELVQGLPAVGRDADVWDVVADMAGFALGWAVLAVGRRRGWPGFRE